MRYNLILVGSLGGAATGVAALFLAWESAGGGHGTYFLAKCLFPYTMYLAKAHTGRISAPLLTIALLEFPAYGFAIGWAASRGRMKVALATILILHVVALALCFTAKNADFAGLHRSSVTEFQSRGGPPARHFHTFEFTIS